MGFFRPTGNFGSLLRQKSYFLFTVYLVLLWGGLLTYGSIDYLDKNKTQSNTVNNYYWAWFILSLIIIYVLILVKFPWIIKFGLFSLFSVLWGFLLNKTLSVIPISVIQNTLLGVMGIFLTMTAIGFLTAFLGLNLNFMSFFLFILLIAFVLALVVAELSKASALWIRALMVFGIVLFSAYLVHDTNLLLQKSSVDSIDGAVGLYMDVLLLFTEGLNV